ncbi:MAG: hypothetical protein GSR80_000264 [Desulfurococcales archaeon]|nr:hypothetical protein [Desulfurococcales archaeon]
MRAAKRRAIDPVVSLIIIIAATIAVALAFASWMYGFWGVHARVHGQLVEIYDDTYFNSSNSTLMIHVKVHIDPSAVLWVEVPGAHITSVSLGKIVSGSPQVVDGKVYAPVGSEFWLAVRLDRSYPAGTTVYFRIYTEKGYVFWFSCLSK